jgi:hypothetical protein
LKDEIKKKSVYERKKRPTISIWVNISYMWFRK